MGSVVGNRFFNDPNIGAAFSNLQSMFAPPSGSDLSGYATAAATKANASRLAELFAYGKDPNYNQAQADRMSVLGGLYAPNQSYYSVDQGNATARRGQDVTASTSIFNNQSDNARALQQTGLEQDGALVRRNAQDEAMLKANDADNIVVRQNNTADNDRAILTNRADNNRQAMTSLYGTPVGQNEILPAVPADVAGQFGLPARDPVVGAIMAGQGDTVTLPDNRVIKGADKPLTEEQAKAAILQGLPSSEQRIVALGNAPVENVVGTDGKTPVTKWRADSVGEQPFVKSTAEPTELAKLIGERDALPQGDPRRSAYDQRIAALNRGQQQPKYDQVNEENLAKLNDQISSQARSAFSDQRMLSTIRTALNDPSADQGALGATNLALKKYLNAFGIDAGNTSSAEMVNALGNQLALRLRDPSNGAGMPGALSDSDREFLKSMVASLGNSPEANQKIVDYYMALQEKNIGLEALRQKYVAPGGPGNGRLDDGFRAQMADYLRSVGLPEMAGGAAPVAADPTSPTATVEQPRTATNPKTGEKIMFQNGQWVPAK